MADNEKQTMEDLDAVKEAEQGCEANGQPEGMGADDTIAGDASAENTLDQEVDQEEAALEEETDEEPESCDEESEEGAGSKSWAEKRAAKKQAKQDKKSDEWKAKIAELEDKNKRQLAEFENFRRRTEKEKQAMFETGAKSVIEKILPVIDNFERGFATVDPADAEDAFVKGMSQVYKQMMAELDKIGVKPIEAVGQEFDPNFHNAVMQVQSEEYEAGIVAQELQKGYTYRDNVVRYSMVAVVSE